jgi:hypothetical protein
MFAPDAVRELDRTFQTVLTSACRTSDSRTTALTN